jgi:hypothetical protein
VVFGRFGRWQQLSVCLSVAVIGLLLLWMALAFDNFRQSQKAAEMIRSLGTLQLGASSTQDAISLVKRFGGSRVRHAQTASGGQDDCDDEEVYNVTIAPRWIETIRKRAALAIQFGLIHYWTLNAGVHLKSGILACIAYTIVTGQHDPAAILDGSFRPHSPWNQEESYSVGFDPFPRGHELTLRAYPDASPEQHSLVFQPDLHCLSNLRGCQYPCELSPAGWQQYLKTPAWQHLVLGYDKPPEADDPRCAAQ